MWCTPEMVWRPIIYKYILLFSFQYSVGPNIHFIPSLQVRRKLLIYCLDKFHIRRTSVQASNNQWSPNPLQISKIVNETERNELWRNCSSVMTPPSTALHIFADVYILRLGLIQALRYNSLAIYPFKIFFTMKTDVHLYNFPMPIGTPNHSHAKHTRPALSWSIVDFITPTPIAQHDFW